MTKAELRKQFLTERKALTAEKVTERSQRICDQFFSLVDQRLIPLREDMLIHIFLPIVRQNEVNTWLIIHRLWQDFPDVRVATSVTDTASNQLTHYLLSADTLLVENQWGIPEPALLNQSVTPTNIDIVLVPLLIFDKNGHRVGYGKGYYDRFLSKCRPDCLKVGVSLFKPVDQVDNTESTDVGLNVCISAEKIWRFNPIRHNL